MDLNKQHIFIIGSKGIPAKYGGFETFVEHLTKSKKDQSIQYHVSCLADNRQVYTHNESRCFNISVPNIGPAKAVLYDVLSLKECYEFISKNNIHDAIIYILACRIGPFLGFYKRKLEKFNTQIFVNPDGHEWKRSKWNAFIRRYWKFSESIMVKKADLLICDSIGIQNYITEEYKKYRPQTTYIAYGADTVKSTLNSKDSTFINWMDKNKVREKDYYLVVGRFVPENNYELMIREFMRSNTRKDFVIISNVENNTFYKDLLQKTHFEQDKRIKFVGTVYDGELLKKIREEAFGYFHGHEVGGTNPSLLEAMASTQLNLLLDVVFNREVGLDGAVYFEKTQGSLAKLIAVCDGMDEETIKQYQELAVDRIQNAYTWNLIIQKYEAVFKGMSQQYVNDIALYPAQGVVKA
ncbi:glycosyltransferase family 1 protein [Paenibacillus albicereus]|uniref:Glycosyltransferase family 1 protein n=1 Tax=Paenibacillus albicereus TaxID=2726185 RepID=A0A6H2GUP3_9BACL|nr:DUF1972 domain-containing protein [Paenibacillus albicereus]QJC51130.1 glycosyltransferase family 1 protein [Paenibacillus albicereus]